jgi:predicted nucleic acid-binding protein
VSALLDTSVVVRYLTGEPPEAAAQAAAIIDSPEQLTLPEVALAEVGFVLGSVYGVGREAIVDALVALLRRENITPYCVTKDDALEALLMCRPSARVSFADALIWAAARSTEDKAVYSFDARFPRDGIDLRDRQPG